MNSKFDNYRPFLKATETLENCNLTNLTSFDLPENAKIISSILATSDPWLTLHISKNAIENYISNDDSNLYKYLIKIEDEISGIICIRNPWLIGPYIELFGLKPECRNLGIGREIINWIELETRHKYKNLWVTTSSFNIKALNFYKKQGFYKIGVIDELLSSSYDEILLRKRL